MFQKFPWNTEMEVKACSPPCLGPWRKPNRCCCPRWTWSWPPSRCPPTWPRCGLPTSCRPWAGRSLPPYRLKLLEGEAFWTKHAILEINVYFASRAFSSSARVSKRKVESEGKHDFEDEDDEYGDESMFDSMDSKAVATILRGLADAADNWGHNELWCLRLSRSHTN